MRISSFWNPSVGLTVAGMAALSLGILAFLLDIFGFVRMPFTLTFASLPGAVVVGVLAVRAGRADEFILGHRLRSGFIAGLWATLAYDGLRWTVQASGLFAYDAFQSMPLFGSLITGLPPAALMAVASGWTYHFWNGISFAMMYALLASGRHWAWGLTWAMFLETAMVFTYPVAFGVSPSDPSFLSISFLGHAAYGITLGVLVQRAGARPKTDRQST